MKPTILILGAAGKTGQAVIRALVRSGDSPAAFVRDPDQLNRVLALGAKSVATGDLADADDLARVMQGVQTVYAIFPNMHPDEFGLGQRAIAAAQTAGVERFVYHSVLHPQTEAMPHHWQKLRVEEALLTSGLAFTVLQPSAYMQNVLSYREAIRQDGRYAVPYAATTKLGMVDLEDVAAAAARVLTESGHAGATYQLAGAEVLNPTQIARTLSKTIRSRVEAEAVDRAAWEAGARAGGMSDYQVDALRRMFEYYEHYGFGGNPGVLEWLLGRRATTFAEFCRREFPD